MKEMQFSFVVMMIMMCSALIFLMPGRVRRDRVINRSRWLMVGALGLIGLQFLIQYVTQLRAVGITPAVLVNLLFFVPASGLMSLTVLNLQRQGKVSRTERSVWAVVSLLVMVTLVVMVWIDGRPLDQLSDRVRITEIILSFVYAVMQIYYSVMQFRELVRMEEAIENYYDRERKGLTRWMKHAIAITGLLAMFVPLLIFGPFIVLIIYGMTFFWGIFMMWFSFVRYFTSNAINRVREAEESAEESEREEKANGLSADAMQNVSMAVERWLASGGHLQAGITSPIAADAMGVPRYQLTAWVKASGYHSFTKWIIAQRIEEAKRVIMEHRDWTNEAVADHCGFSRAYFQKIFKQETGVAPSEYNIKNDN